MNASQQPPMVQAAQKQTTISVALAYAYAALGMSISRQSLQQKPSGHGAVPNC